MTVHAAGLRSLFPSLVHAVAVLGALVLLAACGSTSSTTRAQSSSEPRAPLTVQPGAPGEPTRVLSQDELRIDDRTPYTEADVAFMQGMIAHHAQALDMTALVPDRSDDEGLRLLALRIEISQKDEIAMMQSWLRKRGEDVPAADAHAHMHHMGGNAPMLMPGMLDQAQMDRLATSSGDTFYRLFLEYMIQHHQGALIMVQELFSQDGAGQGTEIFTFAADVEADQEMEITRMQQMLEE